MTWWRGRSLQARITVLAATITLGCLLGLAALAAAKLSPLLIDSVDRELTGALAPASAEVSAGRALPTTAPVTVRVLDISGTPVDGGAPSGLSGADVGLLKAGQPVQQDGARYLGAVVSTPDGTQRLVVAGAGLVGFSAAVHYGGVWLVVVASVGALVAGLATWLVVRLALRPVARMRGTVRALPPGARLPLPDSHDELRALAEEFNALLERQEQASERLRRFTGDAAHELRSPVASIRVQAEVAVTNPDPELSQETLGDILTEAERLSSLLDGLLSLARSDAGEVPPAEPVELVSEVRAAVGRLSGGRAGDAGEQRGRAGLGVGSARRDRAGAGQPAAQRVPLRARGDRGVGAGVTLVGAGRGRRRRPGHRTGAPREGLRPVLSGVGRPGPHHRRHGPGAGDGRGDGPPSWRASPGGRVPGRGRAVPGHLACGAGLVSGNSG